MNLKHIIITAIISAALFGGGMYFSKIITPPPPATDTAQADESAEQDKLVFSNIEKIITNYSSEGRSKTAMISAQITAKNTSTYEDIEELKILIIDAIIVSLKGKNAAYFETKIGVEQMKVDFAQITKDVLTNNNKDVSKVHSVLITNFVTQ